MLEIDNLRAGYGRGHVIDGMSLSIAHGECVALLGRNGSGRSTLLKAIIGLLPPEQLQGRIAFEGVAITGRPTFDIARRGIGYVPEGREVFPHLTVAQNLRVGEPPAGAPVRPNSPPPVDPYALFPALAGLRHKPAGVLSGGEQQMLAIARALAGRPSLLLVDEPTEGLAPAVMTLVARALASLRDAGIAILLVEQKMKIAPSLARRVAVIGRGRIAFHGTFDELLQTESIRAKWLGVSKSTKL
jgi:branched-chain amino acid transport system ATP-binding protein